MPPLCQTEGVRCQNEKLVIGQVEQPLSRPFSSAKPRGSHRTYQRFFKTERPFSLAHRIGSVIREQRPARATTRTTGCSLKSDSDRRAMKRACRAVRVMVERNNETPSGTPGAGRAEKKRQIPRRGRCQNSENIRWSSRPSPVNRLQATGEPKYRESGRRVMLGGSISECLAPKNRTDPYLWATTGKALAFTKEQTVQYWYSTGTAQFKSVQVQYRHL